MPQGVPAGIAGATRLRVLRLDENCLSKGALPVEVLRDSNISLITIEGNPLTVKQFQDLDGCDPILSSPSTCRRPTQRAHSYPEYEKRYTETKKKLLR